MLTARVDGRKDEFKQGLSLYLSCSSGLLPNAVLPPSLDHNYAQWQEREEIARAEQPLRKKIIPAPCSKTHVEPDSPTSPPPPRPLLPPPLPMLHGESAQHN